MYIPSPYKSLDKAQIKEFIQENSFGTLILTNNRQVPDINDDDPSIDFEKGPSLEPPQIREKLARHIPFEIDVNSDHYLDGIDFETLTGHMATHYPIYKCFDDGDEALIIFQGPHSYVSPSWYDNLEASTWNYISIHVYGKIERLDIESTVKKCVEDLKLKLEKDSKNKRLLKELAHAEFDLKEIQKGRAPQLEKLLQIQLYKYEKRSKCAPMMSLERLGERYQYLRRYIGAIRIHIDSFETDVQAAFKLSQDQTRWSQNNIVRELKNLKEPGAEAIAKEMEKI